MALGAWCDQATRRMERGVSQCDDLGCGLKLRNESGTNRARIGDSAPLLIRSPQHLALTLHGGTRSSLTQAHKRGFGSDFLKASAGAESNQKWGRVNRDSSALLLQLAVSASTSSRGAKQRS